MKSDDRTDTVAKPVRLSKESPPAPGTDVRRRVYVATVIVVSVVFGLVASWLFTSRGGEGTGPTPAVTHMGQSEPDGSRSSAQATASPSAADLGALPSVVGWNCLDALGSLRVLGLGGVTVQDERHASIAPTRQSVVVEQSVAAGSRFDAGTAVVLVCMTHPDGKE